MSLYFIRHGQSRYNILGLCNDDPQRDSPLTDLGREQAAEAAETLKNVSLIRLICTELPRTCETAEIINRYHHLEIETEPRLNDIVSGFDNLPVADYFEAVGNDRLHSRPNGGESLLDYRARVTPVLEELSRDHHSNIAVVVHEETLRVIWCHFQGLDESHLQDRSFGNCEILRFDS